MLLNKNVLLLYFSIFSMVLTEKKLFFCLRIIIWYVGEETGQ